MDYGDGLGNNVNLAADSGNYGQFAIGTFTASGTSLDLFMATSGFANVHYNAIMVQVIPEPSTLIMVGLALGAAALLRRRKS
jgi:hypothetical protein